MNIVEIAKQIGVSKTTVSSALRGTGRLSPETRQRVLEELRNLGYTPNVNAQRLVTGRSLMIALHHTNQEMLTDLFLVELTRDIQRALNQHSYGLLLDTASDFSEEDYPLRRWIASRAVDGVILVMGWSPVHDWIRQFASPILPVVVYGDVDISDLPYAGNVRVDLESGVREVARHLVELGHERIGYIGIREPDGMVPIFRRNLEALGVTLPKELVICAGFAPGDGARAIRELLARPSPPTAVFCRKDDLAVGALNAAARLGVDIPGRLSLVGHDDVALAGVLDPPLTTVRINCAGIGQAAVELLFDLLADPDTRPVRKFLTTSLVVRESTAWRLSAS